MIGWVLYKLIVAHLLATPAFLILRIWSAGARSRTTGFLAAANGTALVLACFVIIDRVVGLYQYPSRLFIGYDYFALVCWAITAGVLLSSFFQRRAFRRVVITWVALVLLILSGNARFLIIYLASPYHDFLPSGVGGYGPPGDRWYTAAIAIAFYWICWMIGAMKGRAASTLQK